MRIEVHRNETSNPIVYETALDAYTKGPMYCVLFEAGDGKKKVHKYPLCSLFRVTEENTESGRA